MTRRRSIALLILVGVAAAVGVGWWARHLRTRPDDVFQSALTALDQRDLRAVEDAIPILEQSPGYEQHVTLLRGALLMRKQQPQRAMTEFARLEPVQELRQPALLLTGECLYYLGRLSEAEALMRQAAQAWPENSTARRWLGAIYFDLGANELAIVELKKLVELEPDDFSPHHLLGLMYYDFEQSVDAIKHLRKALSLSPPQRVQGDIRAKLASSLIHERQYEAALEVVNEASPDAPTLVLKSECLWSLGRGKDAEDVLAQARALDPDFRELLLLESRIYVADGRLKEAIGPLTRALNRDQHDAECRYQLAQVHQRLGDTDAYESEIALWEESKALLEQLTELNIRAIREPHNIQLRVELSGICRRLNKNDLAKMWQRAADSMQQPTPFRTQ